MKVKLNLQLRLPENGGARLVGYPLKETAHVDSVQERLCVLQATEMER